MSLNNQYLSLTHIHACVYTHPGRNLSYREISDQTDTLEWLLGPDWLTVRGLRINVFACKSNSSCVFESVWLGSFCLLNQLSVHSQHINIKMVVRIKPARPRTEPVHPWTRLTREASRWAQGTKASAHVSKHGPHSPPRGQELRII